MANQIFFGGVVKAPPPARLRPRSVLALSEFVS